MSLGFLITISGSGTFASIQGLTIRLDLFTILAWTSLIRSLLCPVAGGLVVENEAATFLIVLNFIWDREAMQSVEPASMIGGRR